MAEVHSTEGHASPLGSFERFLVPALIGFGPSIVLILTWDPHGLINLRAPAIREFSLPLLAAEGMIIGIAVSAGLFRWIASAKLPKVILLCLAGWALIAWGTALFAAPLVSGSVFMTTAWCIHALFGLSVAYLLSQHQFDPDYLLVAMLSGFILYTLLLMLFALTVDNPAQFDWLNGLPGLGHVRRSGCYATAMIMLSIGLLAVREKRIFLPLLAATIGFFFIFWTGARAAILAMAAATAICWLLFPQMRKPRILVLALAAAAIGLLFALLYPVSMGELEPSRLVTNHSSMGRTTMWQLTFHEFLHRPLFGHGEGQNAVVLRRNFMAHPHNLVLQILFAWGIAGFVCVAGIATWIGRFIIVEGRRSGGLMLPFVLAPTALLFQSMVDGCVYDVSSLNTFAACLGAAAGLAMRDRRGEGQAVP